MQPVRAGLILALSVAGALACGRFRELPTDPLDPDPVNPAATLTAVQQAVFTPTCTAVGCHDALGAATSAQLQLTPGHSFGNLVNVSSTQLSNRMRVSPGRPEESYLMNKITGTQPMTGERMPFGSPALSDSQVRLIRDWIRRGAPND